MPRTTRRSEVVCKTCNDTHRMTLSDGAEGGDSRKVICTRCPVPCQRCRVGGNGPYCESMPCACACHDETTRAEAVYTDHRVEAARVCKNLKVPGTAANISRLARAITRFVNSVGG